MVELTQALPMSVVHSIFDLFRQRYMAADGTLGTLDVQGWLSLVMVCLPKEEVVREFSDLRGITLIDVLKNGICRPSSSCAEIVERPNPGVVSQCLASNLSFQLTT